MNKVSTNNHVNFSNTSVAVMSDKVEEQVISVINTFLFSKGSPKQCKEFKDLFPNPWKIRSTVIPLLADNHPHPSLVNILPVLSAYDVNNDQLNLCSPTLRWASVDHLTAEFPSLLMTIRSILSATSGRSITENEVICLAEQAPEAIEEIKTAAKSYKSHILRFLNPDENRTDPSFQAAAAHHRDLINAAIEIRRRKFLELQDTNRELNKLIAKRDAELTRLDPQYVPEPNVLSKYGVEKH